MERSGSHRRTRLIICCAHIPMVLCRLPSRSLTSGVVASTHKKGRAHRCFVQGGVTTMAMTIQRNPGLLDPAFSAREGTISIMPPFADLAPPPSPHRFVDDH